MGARSLVLARGVSARARIDLGSVYASPVREGPMRMFMSHIEGSCSPVGRAVHTPVACGGRHVRAVAALATQREAS